MSDLDDSSAVLCSSDDDDDDNDNETEEEDSVELDIDQIFADYPAAEKDALRYTVCNPFVRCDQCHDCDDYHGYSCTLCGREDMTESAAKHHLSEPSHIAKVDKARRKQETCMDVIHNWKEIHDDPAFKRLKRKHAVSLPDHVLAQVLRCVKTQGYSRRQVVKHKAAALLEKYENLERLSLLHLCVWKAECLAQMPALTFLAARQWMTTGWKDGMAEQRQSSAMQTIVALVFPFL